MLPTVHSGWTQTYHFVASDWINCSMDLLLPTPPQVWSPSPVQSLPGSVVWYESWNWLWLPGAQRPKPCVVNTHDSLWPTVALWIRMMGDLCSLLILWWYREILSCLTIRLSVDLLSLLAFYLFIFLRNRVCFISHFFLRDFLLFSLWIWRLWVCYTTRKISRLSLVNAT